MSLLFEEFKTICFHLNRIGITPTLMGSLGLEFRTKENWEPSDIDIHVAGDPRGGKHLIISEFMTGSR